MGIIVGILMGLFLVDCILLVVVILLQSGKSGGLASAFGAGGAADSAFGAKVSQPLRRVTIVMAGIFLATATALAIITSITQQKTVGAGGTSTLGAKEQEQPAEQPAAKPDEGLVPEQPATKPDEGSATEKPATKPDEGLVPEQPADSGTAETPADKPPADAE